MILLQPDPALHEVYYAPHNALDERVFVASGHERMMTRRIFSIVLRHTFYEAPSYIFAFSPQLPAMLCWLFF